MKNPNISCRSHWNPSDKTASLFNKEEMLLFLISLCFHALCRAILISTLEKLDVFPEKGCVSMPSIGRTPFLRTASPTTQTHPTFVSMPSIGRSSFLPGTDPHLLIRFKSCQCPPSGNPHFYPALSEPAVLAVLRARFCM